MSQCHGLFKLLATLAFTLVFYGVNCQNVHDTLQADNVLKRVNEFLEALDVNDTTAIVNGEKVSDPYRWLEDTTSAEAQDFIALLNSISVPFLDTSNFKAMLDESMKKVDTSEKYEKQEKHGDDYYYWYKKGNSQRGIYKQKKYTGKGELFLSAYEVHKHGYFNYQTWSEDGSIIGGAYSNNKLEFWKNGHHLPDSVKIDFGGNYMTLLGSKGVFYIVQDLWKTRHRQLFFRKFNSSEPAVHMASFKQITTTYPVVTRDQRYLLVVAKEHDGFSTIYCFDLKEIDKVDGKIPFTQLFLAKGYHQTYVGNYGQVFVFRDQHEVYLVDAENAKHASDMKVVITYGKNRWFKNACVAGGQKLVVLYYEHGSDQLMVYDLKTHKSITTPLDFQAGYDISCDYGTNEVFVSFEKPSAIYRVDVSDNEPHYYEVAKAAGWDNSDVVYKKLVYQSKDGTEIPMSIIHAKDVKLDGQNPVMMSPFSIKQIYPSSPDRVFVEKMGGVIAVPYVRGTGTPDASWYRAGTLEHKQNMTDDFIAAAEYLIQENYTCPEKLVAQGFDSAGALVATVAQQRPDLFAAIVVKYGYLPPHKVQIPNEDQWPATLLITTEEDDNAIKYAAKIYRSLTPLNRNESKPVVVLVRKQMDGGSLESRTNDDIEMYSFVQRVLFPQKEGIESISTTDTTTVSFEPEETTSASDISSTYSPNLETDILSTYPPNPETDISSTYSANPEPNISSAYSANSEPNISSTYSANPELDTSSTYSANPEPNISSTYSANSEPNISSTYSANPEPDTSSTYSANPEPNISSTYSANPEPSSNMASTPGAVSSTVNPNN